MKPALILNASKLIKETFEVRKNCFIYQSHEPAQPGVFSCYCTLNDKHS